MKKLSLVYILFVVMLSAMLIMVSCSSRNTTSTGQVSPADTTTVGTITTTQTPSNTVTGHPTGPEVSYVAQYNHADTGGSLPYDLKVDDLGNVYIAGYTGYQTSSGSTKFTTMKYDSRGKLQWEAVYQGPGDGNGAAFALTIDSSGNVYVTGQNEGTDTGLDYATIKYNSEGNQLWVARYNGPGNGDDGARSIAVDTTGVYVTGSSTGSDGNKDYLTVKYNLNGNQLWEARYNGPENGDDFARSLAVDNTGNVYVTGTDNGIAGEEGGSSYLPRLTVSDKGKGYYLTVKYDSSGQQLWTAAYKGTGEQDDLARVIKVDSSGNSYVTGESSEDAGYEFATVKYDTNGKQLWEVSQKGPEGGPAGAFDMVLDGSGNILVTGYGGSKANGEFVRAYDTIKYNAAGNQLWAATYTGLYGDNTAYSIAIDAVGSVYVTGVSGFIKYDSTAYENYATVKYDSEGSQLWAVRYGDGDASNNVGRELALDTAGNIYVTGTDLQHGAEYSSINTIKYARGSPANTNQLISIRIGASSTLNLGLGYTVYLTAAGSYSDGSTKQISSQVTWASSNPAVASVSHDGAITGKSVGNTDITASLDGVTSPAVTLTIYVETRTPITP